MHTEHQPLDPDVLNEMGYERRDININGIKKWTIGFFGLAFFFGVLAWIFFSWLAHDTIVRSRTREANVTRRIPPAPAPLLQDNITTKVDIFRMRQEEEQALHSYGYANEAKTRVHIPIERAMEVIAQQGVGAVEGTGAGNNDAATTAPTGSQTPGAPLPESANPPRPGNTAPNTTTDSTQRTNESAAEPGTATPNNPAPGMPATSGAPATSSSQPSRPSQPSQPATRTGSGTATGTGSGSASGTANGNGGVRTAPRTSN